MKKEDFTILLLKYWRNCLADADRTAFDPKDFDNSEEAVGIPLRDVANGQISAVQAESLIAAYKEGKFGSDKKNRKKGNIGKYSQAKNDEDEIEAVKVLVCPLIAEPIPEHGKQVAGKDRPIAPVWIPATLYRDGRLAPVSDDPPWIPRMLLEPMETNSQTLGDLEASDEFLGANPFPPGANDPGSGLSWGDVWRYSDEMLRAVSGQTLEKFSLEGFTVWPCSYISLDTLRGSAKEIIKFYDHLRRDLEKDRIVAPALLERYVSLNDNKLLPILLPAEMDKNYRLGRPESKAYEK
jgi:hypothetical protein